MYMCMHKGEGPLSGEHNEAAELQCAYTLYFGGSQAGPMCTCMCENMGCPKPIYWPIASQWHTVLHPCTVG